MMAAWSDLSPSDVRLAVAALLALAAVLGMARLLVRHLRAEPALRPRAWRTLVLLAAQPLCALLLHLALFPPPVHTPAGTLLVATAGTTRAALAVAPPSAVRVALPEAPASLGLERVPDLATALRRHPGTQRLRILGRGLEARDREAVRGLALDLDLLPVPRGLVHLDAPSRAVVGSEFVVAGQVAGMSGGSVDLLDPGGRRIARALPGDAGLFALTAPALAAGNATFRLQLRDAARRLVERVDVPVLVEPDPPPRVLVLAGAPGPEVKHLRRWARDAGLDLRTRIDAGGGLAMGDAPARLDAAALARFDAVVLDDRAWTAMGEAQRGVLRAAVRDGLGLLLRLTSSPAAAERGRLRALGFVVEGDGALAPARIGPVDVDADALRARLGTGTADAPRLPDDPTPEAPVLARRSLRIVAADGLPLAHDREGVPLGLWRAEGRGRIGLWTLADSHRLVLAGRDDLHGALWSGALATVARAQSATDIAIPDGLRPHARVVLCGLPAGTRITAPDGQVIHPVPDPATGTPACAGYWPRQAGWHQLEGPGVIRGFHVRGEDEAPALRAATLREATLRIASGAPADPGGSAARPGGTSRPGPRWPWWLAWLVASAGLWWFERSRLGHRARSTMAG